MSNVKKIHATSLIFRNEFKLKQCNEIIINLELFVKFNYLINLSIMAYIFAFSE